MEWPRSLCSTARPRWRRMLLLLKDAGKRWWRRATIAHVTQTRVMVKSSTPPSSPFAYKGYQHLPPTTIPPPTPRAQGDVRVIDFSSITSMYGSVHCASQVRVLRPPGAPRAFAPSVLLTRALRQPGVCAQAPWGPCPLSAAHWCRLPPAPGSPSDQRHYTPGRQRISPGEERCTTGPHAWPRPPSVGRPGRNPSPLGPTVMLWGAAAASPTSKAPALLACPTSPHPAPPWVELPCARPLPGVPACLLPRLPSSIEIKGGKKSAPAAR